MNKPSGMAVDSKNNVYIGTYRSGRVRVICYDIVSAGFCNGKTLGFMYFFLGTGSEGYNAAHNASAPLATQTGRIYGLRMDQHDNLIIGVHRDKPGISVVCDAAVGGLGICNGKTAGLHYYVAGNGLEADGASGASATATSMLRLRGVAINTHGNTYSVDKANRMRIVCNDVVSDPGFCNGKTVGFIYHYWGNGSTGVTASGLFPSTSMVKDQGTSSSLNFDKAGMLISTGNNGAILGVLP